MPLEVFFSYSHEDEKLRDKLEKQLSLLQRSGLIVSWHDRRIGAGEEWRDQIDAHVRSAHIILLLISSDFIASDYCYGVELQIALERQQRGEAVVIPVILRSVDWSIAPFAKLQALPRDGKPITKWDDEDEAFADVARGIRAIVIRFQALQAEPRGIELSRPLLIDKLAPKPRVVDAAIPSHVVKDLATKLLVLIRLPDSPGLRGILQADEDSEARPKDVRSNPFKVTFPLGPTGKPDPLKVAVKVTSPDFSPPEQTENIFVPPEEDSEPCPFLLTPRRVGRLTVLVKLQWEDAVGGHRSLLTKCVADAAEAPAEPEMNLVQMPVLVSTGSQDAIALARETLSSAGSSDEAREALAKAQQLLERARQTSASAPRDLASRGHIPPLAPSPPVAATRPPAQHKLDRVGAPAETIFYQRGSPIEEPESNEAKDLGGAVKGPWGTPMPGPARSPAGAKLPTLNTTVIVAIIGAISAITGSYWQFVYKPQHSGGIVDSNKLQVTITGQVLNARTREFTPNARVTLALESGTPPLEQYTDSNGNFNFHLENVKRGTQGRVYVHASDYEVFEQNLVISDSSLHEELRIEPHQNSPSLPKPPQTISFIAGRVLDSSTNSGISHAHISLAGRPETYLTDDNGNFRVRMAGPFPNEGVRLQIKKAGCATLDQVVRPPTENLMLELHCTPGGLNPMGSRPVNGPAGNAINEISRGPYSPMPKAHEIGSDGGAGTTLTIENTTEYYLTVYLSGPSHQTIKLDPGGQQEVTLVGRKYRFAAKADRPEVLPLYGEEPLAAGKYLMTFSKSPK